jgi:hypothetical protein
MDTNNPIADLLAKKEQAKADLATANSAAEALLADLEAKDAVNSTAGSVAAPAHQMPSPYAPGDPRNGVAAPSPADQLHDALESSFRPVNMKNLKENTLPSSKTVDFAQKIRDANKNR